MALLNCQEKLADAREKYHLLLTGAARVKVQKNGRMIEYQQADASKLKDYIIALEAECGTPKRRAPARVFF